MATGTGSPGGSGRTYNLRLKTSKVGNPKTGIKMYDSRISGCSRTTLVSVASSQCITSLKAGYSNILVVETEFQGMV